MDLELALRGAATIAEIAPKVGRRPLPLTGLDGLLRAGMGKEKHESAPHLPALRHREVAHPRYLAL